MPKAQETCLTINLGALKHNYEYLKSKLSTSTKFLAVVKAFAYGSDAERVALYLEVLDVDYFAVAYTSEGIALRHAGITKPILVLHPLPIHFDEIIEHCLEPALYNAKVLKTFIATAEKHKQKDYPIHIKFNTGLNRLGFWESDVNYIASKLEETKSLNVKSIFSHMAASEDLKEKDFTLNQISNFKTIASNFEKIFGYKPLLHMCNTSGVINYPDAHFDMVRCGIGLYGFGNSTIEDKNLRSIASLKSVISQIHKIEPNETVGYNRAYSAKGYETTATIPIGHADGIGRHYGNEKGFVIVNGKKAPIIGNVCMDMIMVNVSNIKCTEGDEVIIFDETYPAETLAGTANTISYELLTAISPRVKRLFING